VIGLIVGNSDGQAVGRRVLDFNEGINAVGLEVGTLVEGI